jgi:hypothetical protein
VTALGTQASEVALLVQAKQLTGSPLAVGLLGVVELVPLVVFGLYGGVLADRFDRRALMRWGEVSAVMMAAASLQRPSFDASLPRLVRRDQLTAASALLSMSQNASFMIGSALGGVLAVTPGPWLVYGVDGAGFAVSFGLLTRLRPLPGSSGDDHATWRGITAGLRYAVRRQDLLGSYLADLTAMIFAYPNALSAGAWGVMMAGFGLSPDLYVALACLIAAGAADMVSGIFRSTLWNQTIPDALRGRLAGVELLSYGVGPSAGQLRSGVVASLVSTRFSLVSGGLFCVGGVAVVCALLPGFVRYKSEPA